MAQVPVLVAKFLFNGVQLSPMKSLSSIVKGAKATQTTKVGKEVL